MLYRITIEEVIETDVDKYPNYKSIYTQQIADINISETVKFLNRGETAKVGSIQNPDTLHHSTDIKPYPLTYC